MKIETGQRLYPNSDLEGKNFFKVWRIIDRDGTVHSRVTLNIPDSELREGLICKHYLARYTQEVVKSDVFIELISRDNPWDFELLLSTGNKLKIEITAIADDRSMFVKMKREDRFMSRAGEPVISLHELEKLCKMFPDEENQTLINAHRSNGLKSNSPINNPYYQQQDFAFHGMAPIIERAFGDLLMEAITKKINKKHPNKNEVILIIDNRTIHYELEDILTSLSNYSSQLSELPFKEVVIYTGYYSDITGNDAEYSFIIIKTTDVYHGLTS